MKAQSSVEFLMNYSWMLAIVGVVIGSLFALGFFNQGNWGFESGQTGFGNLAPIENGWKISKDGDFYLKLRNEAGVDLRLWNVVVENKNKEKTYEYHGETIPSGEDSNMIIIENLSSLQKGDNYELLVSLEYGTEDINFTSEGKLWGVVEN